MRAFAYDEFDTPGSVRELPDPEPEAGQVRVRVAVAGTNPADLGAIKGLYKDPLPSDSGTGLRRHCGRGRRGRGRMEGGR